MAEAANKPNKLYPSLDENGVVKGSVDGEDEDPQPTTRIKVSKLPDNATEDAIKYFFENRRASGGGNVDTVDYDKTAHTAVVIFEEAEGLNFVDVQRVIDKGPHLFDKKPIEVERQYIEEEPNEILEALPTTRIKVCKLPDNVTEDAIRYFFENRRVSGGGVVDTVDYDKTAHTAVVIFEQAEDVQRVIDKGPLLFNNKTIEVERHYIEEEPDDRGYDKCTIEVTGMKQSTIPFNITMYFESRKGADSDVLSTDYVEEEEMYLVKFDSEEVVDAVLQKNHVLDGFELNVRKHIPPQAEATYPKQVFVSGFSIKTSKESFSNYLEARSKVDVDKIIYGDIESTAIVIFKEQPDIDKLKVDCKKRNLDGQYLIIDSVPVSKCVIVSGIKEGTSNDAVHFYFDNKKKSGVDGVEDVDLDAVNRTCIVHFVDCEAPVETCKRKHSIEGCTVKVEIYHECLGGTACGDGPKFKPLDPIDFDLDVRKINFLTNSGAGKNNLVKQLKTCYAEVLKWPVKKSGTIKIKCTLTADLKDCKKIVKTWEEDVKKSLDRVLTSVFIEQCSTLQDAWKPVMEKVRDINISNPDLVAVDVDINKCHLYIIGFKQQVTDLSQQIKKIIKEVTDDVEKKKQQFKETLSLRYHEIVLLQMCDFPTSIMKSYKGLEVKLDIERRTVLFEGLSKDAMNAKVNMYEKLQQITFVQLDHLSKHTADFLSRTEVSDFLIQQLKRKKKIGIWEVQGDHLKMYAMSDKEAHGCLQIFKDCIIETPIVIDGMQSSLLKSDLWKQEVKRIMDSKNLVHIFYDRNDKITLLCTSNREAGNIREEIQDFFLHNATQMVSIDLSLGHIQLLQIPPFPSKFQDIEKDGKKDKVTVKLGSRDVSITGNEKGIQAAKRKVEAIVKSISVKNHVISKPGVMSYMQTETGKNKVRATERDIKVVIETLIDREKPEERREKIPSLNPNECMETAQCGISGGRTIITVLGDITLLTCDVIVNAANEDLDHRGGLAKVIVDRGGKEIQAECSYYVNQNGKLSVGSIFCSKPGRLRCKMISHAVGPTWQGGKNNEEDQLRDCVQSSLEATDKRSYTTIAIPAISTGVYGYPKDKATRVIVEAVNDYFKDSTKSRIKTVYLCDVKDDTVKCFVACMKKTNIGRVKQLVNAEETINPWKNHAERYEPQADEHNRNERILTFGNISVQVVKGQLAKQKVNVIVNTTSRDLTLASGMVSNSLLQEGGQTLQNECNQNYPNGIKEGEVAKTSGGNLACKAVFHGCLPNWEFDQSSLKILETFVTECLNIASKDGHTSIAFPSLGTGKLRYPVDKVAQQMFSCVEAFSSSTTKSPVKQVLFVIYDMDYNILRAFEDENRRKLGVPKRAEGRFNKENHVNCQERGRPKSARPTTSHGRQYMIYLNKIQLKVYQGDITTAGVDVIVNSCNTECDLSKGAVAQAILKKGGWEITTELNKQKDEMKKAGIVVTTGGKQLVCDKIIHIDMQDVTKDMKTKIFQILGKTDELQKHKVALPALGTANANVPVEKIAKDMVGVIYNYKPRHIQEVHVVIWQSSTLRSFIDATQKYMDKIKQETAGMMEKIVETVGIGPNNEKRRNREWKATDPVKSEVSCVIYGKDRSDTDKAVKSLEKEIFTDYQEKIINGKIVKELSPTQESEIKALEILEGVEIKVDRRSEKIVLRGFLVNLSPALEKANNLIKIAEGNKQAGQKAELVSDSVEWSYIVKEKGKENLKQYPTDINLKLEVDFKNMLSLSKIIDKYGNKFVVDFAKMEEYSENNQNDSVKVLRKSKISNTDKMLEPPKHWDIMGDEENVRVVVLISGSQEYQDVMKKFNGSVGSPRQIQEIHRVQNKTYYQQYLAKKKLIDSTNPPNHQNEKILWHGFAEDAMESINQYGFNRSYCGKNATAFGDGVYFATSASYSVRDTYSVPDSNGKKRMYMCKVLTGEYTNGNGGIRIPPQKPSPGGAHILYDCVVDNMQSPSMYIIFHDTQAYPEYMILFK